MVDYKPTTFCHIYEKNVYPVMVINSTNIKPNEQSPLILIELIERKKENDI